VKFYVGGHLLEGSTTLDEAMKGLCNATISAVFDAVDFFKALDENNVSCPGSVLAVITAAAAVHKIDSVKLVRFLTSWSLKEAKEFVESLAVSRLRTYIAVYSDGSSNIVVESSRPLAEARSGSDNVTEIDITYPHVCSCNAADYEHTK
jgi:hypothetical protein